MNKSHLFENIPGCSLCWGCLPEGETCKACGTTNGPTICKDCGGTGGTIGYDIYTCDSCGGGGMKRTKLAEQIHKAVGEIPTPLRRF